VSRPFDRPHRRGSPGRAVMEHQGDTANRPANPDVEASAVRKPNVIGSTHDGILPQAIKAVSLRTDRSCPATKSPVLRPPPNLARTGSPSPQLSQ